jgi:hypothetical protein
MGGARPPRRGDRLVTDTHKATIVHVEPREGQKMHPLVQAAIATGTMDPDSLGKLLAVQREWEAGEARKAYTRALALLKADMPTVIAHDQLVDFTGSSGKRTRYTHASLAAVMEAITEALVRHGFSLSWTPSTGEKLVRVTCRLTHTEGHFEEATLEAPADTSGNKHPAQAIMSTVTLLSRYTALALLGLATADMGEPTTTADERAEQPRIDAARTARACAAITKAGRTIEDAEKHVGRARAEWTTADLAVVRAWLGEKPAAAPVNEDAEP